MGTSGHGGQGMGFVTREVKTLWPQLADNLLVGGEKTAGDGVCHGTKESTTGLRLRGSAMVLCCLIVETPGWREQGHCQRDEGVQFVMSRKNTGNLRRAEGGLQRLGGAQT